MRLRLAPLINNPQPSPRSIGGTAIGAGLTGAAGITGHTAITGIAPTGAAGMDTGITVTGGVLTGAATAGIGATGAAGNSGLTLRTKRRRRLEERPGAGGRFCLLRFYQRSGVE